MRTKCDAEEAFTWGEQPAVGILTGRPPCSCASDNGLLRYEQVASTMATISMKRTGRIHWGLIVLCAPEFARLDADAVDLGFDWLLSSDEKRFDYAELFQAVRLYCSILGRPEPDRSLGKLPVLIPRETCC